MPDRAETYVCKRAIAHIHHGVVHSNATVLTRILSSGALSIITRELLVITVRSCFI